jgi:hypothetical protein
LRHAHGQFLLSEDSTTDAKPLQALLFGRAVRSHDSVDRRVQLSRKR